MIRREETQAGKFHELEWELDQPNTELLAARIVELEERCEKLEDCHGDCL